MYHHVELNQTARESCKATLEEVLGFWNRARIPTMMTEKAISKLTRLVTKYNDLKKNKYKKSDSARMHESMFTADLPELFDVAHQNALEIMTIQEDINFLISQREDVREQRMAGIDVELALKEKRKKERNEKCEIRREKEEERKRLLETTMENSSASNSEQEDIAGNEPTTLYKPFMKHLRKSSSSKETDTEYVSVTLPKKFSLSL